MSTKNLIKHENRFAKEYIAEVVSNEDPLMRGRLLVKVPTILGDNAFWVNATLVAGSVRLTLIPEPKDKVTVRFKNKDIYSGEWELKGSPDNTAQIDPKKYGLSDAQGNCIIIDRTTNNIVLSTSANYHLTIAGNAVIQVGGNTDLTTSTCNIHADAINLGDGGQPIARIGDTVEVIDENAQYGGTWKGKITSGGTNTSI